MDFELLIDALVQLLTELWQFHNWSTFWPRDLVIWHLTKENTGFCLVHDFICGPRLVTIGQNCDLYRLPNKQTERQRDRQRDRQTDWQTNRQTNIHDKFFEILASNDYQQTMVEKRKLPTCESLHIFRGYSVERASQFEKWNIRLWLSNRCRSDNNDGSTNISCDCLHDDVMKWKHFPRYWPLWGEFTSHRCLPCTKASKAELWCFLWSAPV